MPLASRAGGRAARVLALAGVAFGVAFGVAPAARLAAQSAVVRLAVPDASVAPGAALDVPVVADFTGATGLAVASLTVRVTYDPARLTLQRTDAGTFGSMTAASPQPGVVAISLFATSATSATFTAGTLRFVAGAQPGPTSLSVAVQSAGDELGRSVAARVQAGPALAVCVGAAAGGEKWGDVNGDGAVDIIDAQQIARSAAGLSVLDAARVARVGDVTGDGAVDVVDAQQIARFAAGLGASARIGQSVGGGGCGSGGGTGAAVARVAVTPTTARLAVGAMVTLIATAADAAGAPVAGRPVTWTTSDPNVARVAGGVVTGVSAGRATIGAVIDGVTGTGTVDVAAGAPVRGVVAGPLGTEVIALGADGSRLLGRADALGRPAGATLQLKDGRSATIALAADGYPQRLVVDQTVLTFANYTATTVDVAMLLPTGETRVRRAVPLDPKSIAALRALAGASAAARMPGASAADPDWVRHLTYLSLGFGVTSCGFSVAATWGTVGATTALAAAVCGATVVEVAAFLDGTERSELASSMGAVGSIASAIGCLGRDVPECLSLVRDAVKNNSDAALAWLAAAGGLLGTGDQELTGAARVTLAPQAARLWTGERVSWTATVFDANGRTVKAPVSWAISRYGVADVDATLGTTVGTDTGRVTVYASVGTATASATAIVEWPHDTSVAGTYDLAALYGIALPQSEGRSGTYYKTGKLTLNADRSWTRTLTWVGVHTASDGTVRRTNGEQTLSGPGWHYIAAFDTAEPILVLDGATSRGTGGLCVRRDRTLAAYIVALNEGFHCHPAATQTEHWKR